MPGKIKAIAFINIVIPVFAMLLFAGVFNSCKRDADEECPKCPRVFSVTPSAAYFHDTVLIIGKYLMPDPNYNDVLQIKFNGNLIPEEYILENYEDSIRLIVPKGTQSGPVTVDINVDDGLVSAGSANFTYIYYVTVSTYAGNGTEGNHDDSDPLLAEFDEPELIAQNPITKDLYVKDRVGTTGAHNIRQIDSNGVVTTIATNMLQMDAIACSNTGVVYVATGSGSACEINTLNLISGLLSDYAGEESDCQTIDAQKDTARFHSIAAMAFDVNNNMYVLEGCNLRFINTQTEMVSTIVGIDICTYVNGPVASATFDYPSSLTVEDNGTIYIADRNNHAIRKISAGMVSTVAGVGTLGFSNGTATISSMTAPKSICTDFEGNILVLEGGKDCVRKINLGANTLNVFAGHETDDGYIEGFPLDARFYNPIQMVFDKEKKVLYIADQFNNRIRKILFE